MALAAVAGAHGLVGEVRLKLFTDDLTRYREFQVGAARLTLAQLRGDIARFEEVGDRNAAEALRGSLLSVQRATLPPLGEGEYYHSDLIGLACFSGGEPVGSVVAVENFGAGDVLEIERPDGRLFMVPMRPEAVPEFGAGRLVIDPAFMET